MLKINKQTITLTKGDDASLRLVPRYKDRTEYVLTEGDRAVFRIKFGHTLVELDCTLNLETNKIVANITPNDTKDFNPGIYRYEAELITSFGFHYTFIADQTFILGQEYEQRITSTSNGNGTTNGNLPEIDGIVDGEPVVYGDIQPTNPMMDYEELNHLPKLNNITIKGSHDNAYYGIPTKTSDLENDSDFVSDDDYVHTDNNYDDTAKNAVDALGTASTKNVPSEGNASPTEVVMGSDTRLSDSRPASDVYDWAKAATKPSYSYSEIQNTPTLGTAAAKNATNTVTSGSTDLVESGAVKSAIDSALSSAYKHGGTKTVEELTSALLIEANQGYVYNITNDGVTTADFIEGAGKPIRAGDNVGIAKVGSAFKFDLLSGFIDTSNFVEKSSTSGLIKNDGTIDTTAYAKQNEMSVSASGDQTTIQLKSGTSATVINAHQDISGKANKSEMFITDGTGADADKTTIQLKDGLSKAVLIAHQDISGKAEKSEMSVTDGIGTDADKTTIQLKSGTSATVLKTHQDISGKADKVSGAANGNLAGLDANGNLTDSGVAKSDIDEMQDELSTDYATVEGNPINFSTLTSQNAESTIIDLEPIQDLHGYNYPWTGGAGKNLLPLTVDGIKSVNTNGTWSGNNYNINGVTFSIIQDNAGNITGIDINTGETTTTARAEFNIIGYFGSATAILPSGSYTVSTTNNVNILAGYSNSAYANTTTERTDTYDNGMSWFFIRIESGSNLSHVVCNPMARLSTIADSTFEPYSNICPISGRTEIGILGCGKNLFEFPTIDNPTLGGIQYTINGSELSGKGLATSNSYPFDGSHSQSYADANIGPFLAGTYKFKLRDYVTTSTSGSRLTLTAIQEDGTTIVSGEKINDEVERTLTATKPFKIGIWVYISSGTNADFTAKMILTRENNTVYEPFVESTNLTISLGQTVYGGTLDVENGVLVVDRGYEIFDGSVDENWNWSSGSSASYIEVANGVITDMTTQYQIFTQNNLMEDKSWVGRSGNGSVGMFYGRSAIYVKYSGFTSVSDLTTYLSTHNLQVCYKLATPITITLSPNTIKLLEGVNNISTDGDKITLTYRDGSVATLGDLTSAVDSLDGKIEDSKILTDTVTGDKYILVVTNGVLDIQQVSN